MPLSTFKCPKQVSTNTSAPVTMSNSSNRWMDVQQSHKLKHKLHRNMTPLHWLLEDKKETHPGCTSLWYWWRVPMLSRFSWLCRSEFWIPTLSEHVMDILWWSEKQNHIEHKLWLLWGEGASGSTRKRLMYVWWGGLWGGWNRRSTILQKKKKIGW